MALMDYAKKLSLIKEKLHRTAAHFVKGKGLEVKKILRDQPFNLTIQTHQL